MNSIRLLDLGTVSPLRSQTVYHAVGYAMNAEDLLSGAGAEEDRKIPDTIIMVRPDRPYVCIGFHQDAERSVDLEYCRDAGLPVYRREVGGGAVLLDPGQVFVQWVFRGDRLPGDLEARFAEYVRPLVETYRSLGIPAQFRPANDIHVGGKKIGGTGAALIGSAGIVVGSLMFTFDKAMMARVLRVSSEKMRDKVHQSLEQYMTTMQEQLGIPPRLDEVKRLYIAHCAASLGRDIAPGAWTSAEEAWAVQIDARLDSEAWLNQKGGLRQSGVKIHEDVRVVEGEFKAPGGLIVVTARLASGRIDDVSITGDFTVLPAHAVGAMEQAVRGSMLDRHDLELRLASVYSSLEVRSPGMMVEDLAAAILIAAGLSA